MKIKQLYIENFKSFGKLEIVFQPINLLIGANASGKSNLISVFELLQSIQNDGITNAIGKMGGFERLLNMSTTDSGFGIKVTLEGDELLDREDVSEAVQLLKKRKGIVYELEVNQKGSQLLLREKIIFHEIHVEWHPQTGETAILRETTYGMTNKFGRFETFFNYSPTKPLSDGTFVKLEEELFFKTQMLDTLHREYKNRSILEYRSIFIPSNLFQFGIYDIQPHVSKQSNHYAVTDLLKKDGSNLTQVVHQILKKEADLAEQFIASVGGVLDFVEDIRVERFENLLSMRVKESYNKKWTDSSLISNGTVSVIALIVALYHQPFQISFLEELEDGIHPALLRQLVERLYEATEYMDKQLFITTQHPQMLKYFYKTDHLKSIFSVSRARKTGHTLIKPIAADTDIADLLEMLDIEALFLQKLIK